LVTQEIKLINGKKYVYLTYYDEKTKKKRSEYCGPDNNVRAKIKALEKELKYTEKKFKEFQNKRNDLKIQIKELKDDV